MSRGRPLTGAARRVRVQLTLDPATVERLDAAAEERSATRSATVERACLEWLAAETARLSEPTAARRATRR